MPPPSKIDQLPDEVRHWLDRELMARRFSGYRELSELLAEKGFEISHVGVWRHGKELKDQFEADLEKIRIITAISNGVDDQDAEDKLSALGMTSLQVGLLESARALSDDADMSPEKRIKHQSEASRAFANLSRAKINQKKWAANLREKLDAKFEALESEAEASGSKSTLDPATLQRIRHEIYGIVT